MKVESIKILIDEIDYKLGRIDYFNTYLEEQTNKDSVIYKKSKKRLSKLIDEVTNLMQIMKLEELDEFNGYEEIFKKLENHAWWICFLDPVTILW